MKLRGGFLFLFDYGRGDGRGEDFIGEYRERGEGFLGAVLGRIGRAHV